MASCRENNKKTRKSAVKSVGRPAVEERDHAVVTGCTAQSTKQSEGTCRCTALGSSSSLVLFKRVSEQRAAHEVTRRHARRSFLPQYVQVLGVGGTFLIYLYSVLD